MHAKQASRLSLLPTSVPVSHVTGLTEKTFFDHEMSAYNRTVFCRGSEPFVQEQRAAPGRGTHVYEAVFNRIELCGVLGDGESTRVLKPPRSKQ